MKIFTKLNKKTNLSLALGFFDGVHLGHQAVIKSAVNFAERNGTKSAVVTFKDHPCCYLWGVCPKYILTREERFSRIEDLGVDYLYELDFKSICNMSADEYLHDVLIKHFSPSAISTGWNHTFGHDRRGNAEFLRQNAINYEYFEVEPQKYNNEIISSTTIRKLLTEGKIEEANYMLKFAFNISGKVVKGNGIGRTIGFKTANLNYPPEMIDLLFGVYDVTCYLYVKNRLFSSRVMMPHKAIANFGVRPTVDGDKAVLEVHLLNFNKEIYGENVIVEFNRMLRPEIKFNSLEELKKQIQADIRSL